MSVLAKSRSEKRNSNPWHFVDYCRSVGARIRVLRVVHLEWFNYWFMVAGCSSSVSVPLGIGVNSSGSGALFLGGKLSSGEVKTLCMKQ